MPVGSDIGRRSTGRSASDGHESRCKCRLYVVDLQCIHVSCVQMNVVRRNLKEGGGGQKLQEGVGAKLNRLHLETTNELMIWSLSCAKCTKCICFSEVKRLRGCRPFWTFLNRTRKDFMRRQGHRGTKLNRNCKKMIQEKHENNWQTVWWACGIIQANRSSTLRIEAHLFHWW